MFEKNLIVLGELHQFKEYEIEELKSSYGSVDFISYKNSQSEDIIERVSAILDKREVSLIVLNTQAQVPEALISFLISLTNRGIEFKTVSDFLEGELGKYYIPSSMNNISFLAKIKPFNKVEYFQKRVIDYLISVPLLLITSPVMLFAIYKIKKESPDSKDIFFKQKRVGLNGQDFECIKFRSMRTDIDYKNDYTQDNDPRVFPWGDFMRKTRIDELPQLFNVLKGDMHLIGPRAEWNKLVKKYQDEIPYYNTRHIVKPGITGWAQVKYKYGANIEDTKEKLMYDLYYIKNWSMWLELKTVWLTIKVILGRKGL